MIRDSTIFQISKSLFCFKFSLWTIFQFFVRKVEWINRLWCVWELAVYLRVNPNPDVIFSSISQRYIDVIAVSGALFLYWIKDLVDSLHFIPMWYEDDNAINWLQKKSKSKSYICKKI